MGAGSPGHAVPPRHAILSCGAARAIPGESSVHPPRGGGPLHYSKARGRPIGTSLGGLIGLDLLESFPAQYAGAVSVSGPVGGSRAEFNYVGDVRALWDLLMPWKFPGTLTQPAGGDFPANQVMACLAGNSQQAGMIAFIHRPSPDRLRVNFLPAPQQAMGQTMGASIAYTCGFHWYGMADAVDRAHGHMLYDNHDVVYVDDGMVPQPMLDWVNANIARYTATPDAGSFLRQHYEPTGSLRQPFLTVHAVDPQVPIQHEDILYDKVAAAGQLDHLLQFRYMNRFGHTDAFTGTEVALAYDALLEWVRTGVKPPTPFTVVP